MKKKVAVISEKEAIDLVKNDLENNVCLLSSVSQDIISGAIGALLTGKCETYFHHPGTVIKGTKHNLIGLKIELIVK